MPLLNCHQVNFEKQPIFKNGSRNSNPNSTQFWEARFQFLVNLVHEICPLLEGPISAAAKARWAKYRGTETKAPKRKMSAEGRARLAAAVKARWAKAKKAGKTRL